MTVGSRPEDLDLAEAAAPSRPGLVIEGTIDLVKSLDACAIATIRSGSLTLQAIVKERLLMDRRAGAVLRFFAPADALHLFDEVTGVRI